MIVLESLDRYKRMMEISGGSIRNEKIRNSQCLLKEVFQDDPSFRFGFYFWALGKLEPESYEDDETLPIRLYERRYSAANGVTVKFQTLLENPVIVGDILYSSKTDEYFICTESFNIDDVHWQGKLTMCNWILKWQKKNGDILQYPCYDINSTQYNSGEQSNKQFTIGSSQHTVLLPYDENTVVLSSPQRFFLDRNTIKPTSFIVTQNDTTSLNIGKKGLVRVTLYEHESNSETDRIDLGICDYIDPNEAKKDTADDIYINKAVIDYDTTIIKSGGDLQTFIAKFYDAEGNEVTEAEPDWYFRCNFTDQLIIKENQSENSISIGIDNDDFIDEEFKLILTDSDHQLSAELLIQIESLL